MCCSFCLPYRSLPLSLSSLFLGLHLGATLSRKPLGVGVGVSVMLRTQPSYNPGCSHGRDVSGSAPSTRGGKDHALMTIVTCFLVDSSE